MDRFGSGFQGANPEQASLRKPQSERFEFERLLDSLPKDVPSEGRKQAKREGKSGATRFGGDGRGVPHVPISNTTVKPSSADGTWTAGSWESRKLPSRSRFLWDRSIFPDSSVGRALDC